MRAIIWPLVFGLVGAAILVSLGVWQVQRLAWKTEVLADIDARIMAAPVAVPEDPEPVADRYLPVRAEGVIEPSFARVLISQRRVGAGYRIISPFTTAGRRLLLDRGVVPVAQGGPEVAGGDAAVIGNLHWPDEIDGFTPENDLAGNIWFSRDVETLAAHFGTEPILIVARQVAGIEDGVTPLPVDTNGIPNDHLNYAITWFSLAIVWLGMTAFLVWRITRRHSERTLG